MALAAALSRRQTHRAPDSLKELVTPDENGNSFLGIDDELPLDPWGNDYQYAPPEEGSRTVELMSFGADGAPGGEGPDGDIIERFELHEN